MMRSADSFDDRLIKAAVAEAVSGARWERIDLETRRPDCAHSELMLAKAAELAMSPVARDQLMSLALERFGQDQQADGPLINDARTAGERDRIAGRVFGLGPHKAADTEALVLAVEARHAARLRQDVCFNLLAQCLEQDAALQEALWDHPDIPAGDAVRLTMLCSIPRLRARAEDLSSSGMSWWQMIRGWFTPSSRRGSP
ncbi:hypothetical protein [uncultured Brevundimonas sp.]|uniref:hypothetical protein n=1 Tax=uncultured Brevundimonas sp. TaxID=213418 RepID=UPI0030EE2C39